MTLSRRNFLASSGSGLGLATLGSTIPFEIVQSSFSGVIALTPVCVNGLYWNP